MAACHAFDDDLGGGRRERGEDAAAVEPADAAGEDGLPVEVARLELGAGLVAAVVEDHGRAHALAAVAIDGGHVGAVDAVVLEVLVEGLHAHGPHPLGDQVADGIIHHRRGDAGLQAEAVGQVGGDVKLAAADVDLALGRLAERDDARVQAVDEGAEGHKVQRATLTDIQAMLHDDVVLGMMRRSALGLSAKKLTAGRITRHSKAEAGERS